MKEAEDAAQASGISKLLLMENAGSAVARTVSALCDLGLRSSVLVVCGAGNNGGDGAAAARHLHGRASITVLLLGGIEKVRTEEASLQWKVLSAMADLKVIEVRERAMLVSLKPLFDSAQVVIDAIFGTGVKGKVGEPQATAIEMINRSKALRISIDIPSGLDPDTGEDHGLVVAADVTVTLHATKPGLLRRPDVAGRVVVEEIGIP
jgi:NAD(P)H-hydrate epimerase